MGFANQYRATGRREAGCVPTDACQTNLAVDYQDWIEEALSFYDLLGNSITLGD